MAELPEFVQRPATQRYTLGPNLALWVIVLAVVGLFSQTLLSLVHVWRETTDYEHGFIIAVISLGLLFQARERIAAAVVEPKPAMLLPLAAVLLVWMVAYRANSEMLQQLAFPVVVMLGILAAFGPTVARIAFFPICYFYFAIPIWDHLVPLLRAMSTATSEGALGLLGVPTQVEGFTVTIPAGKFAIVEGCSGRRYLIVALALAALAGYLQGVRGRRFIGLMACAAALSLVTNWARVIIVIYAGHVSNMQHYFVAVEHHSLGYALYVPLLIAIVWLARRLGTVAPLAERGAHLDVPTSRLMSGFGGSLAVLLLAAVIVTGMGGTSPGARVVLAPPPLLTATWQGPLPAQPEWAPVYANPSDELRASYRSGAHRVEVYANVYGVQLRDSELIQFANSVTPIEAWTIVRSIDIDAPLSAQIAASKANVRWVVAQTHFIGGRQVASPGAAQLLYGWSALWRPTPSGVFALAIACDDDCDAAAAALSAFWNDNAAALAAMIPEKL